METLQPWDIIIVNIDASNMKHPNISKSNNKYKGNN